MTGLLRNFSILVLSLAASGCLYVNASIPLDKNMNETPVPAKTGEAQCFSVLWAVAWGDCGTHTAAKNGNIQTIHNADTHNFVVFFGIFSRQTTIVYGD